MVELETDLSTIIYKNEDGSRTAYIFFAAGKICR